MAKGGFYAVASGRSVGVFTSWGECEAQIRGFPRAKYKKFPSEAEAQAFVAQFREIPSESAFSTRSEAIPVQKGSKRKFQETDNDVANMTQPHTQKVKQDTKFFAVARGHSTGVVTSVEELNRLTEGYPGQAVHEEFKSKEAALAFLTGYQTGEAEAQGSKSLKVTSPKEVQAGNLKKEVWYAVAKGRETGVFTNWNEVKKQIDGFHSAKFKKFETREEAEAFVEQHDAAVKSRPGDPDPMDVNTLVAFCDGSALENGRRGCRAGYACIFPHHTEWNVAKKLVEDRATNNRAEYMAGLEAMKRANVEDPDKSRVLYIFSDSMLLIRSMTEWVGNWQKKGWKKSDGSAVLNRDLLELLVEEKGSRRVLWRHVKAHTGKTDWKSKWNDVADNAARDAAMSVAEQ